MNKAKIIAYLEGRLSEKERQEIADKQATDTDFAKKMADIKADWEIEVMVGRDYLKSQMKEWKKGIVDAEKIEPTLKEDGKVIPFWRKNIFKLSIAASILFLLALGTQQWGSANLSNQAIFSEYYTSTLPQTKGTANDNQLIAIIKLTESEAYDNALEQANQLLSATTDEELQIKINHQIGQIYQQQQDYPNAIEYAKNVIQATNNNSPIWQQTQFNLIVLHLLNGETNRAESKIESLKTQGNLSPDELEKLNQLEEKIKHPLRAFYK